MALGQKLSDLDSASALTGTELIEVTQSSETKKATVDQIETFVKGSSDAFTTSVTISNTAPSFYLSETGAATNEGLWLLQADGNALFLQTRNDANSSGVTIMQVERTGTTVDSISFASTTTFFDNIVSVEGAAATFKLSETDATADNKNWLIHASAEGLAFAAESDDGASSTAWLSVSRTGVSIDAISLVLGTTTEVFRVSSAGAGETALMIYDQQNAALERVSVGAADSGGTGFKVLRIPN